MHISIFLTCVQTAEDKRFAQLAVPESALASRCSLGFFDRCTSSSFVELDRCIRLVHLYSYHDSSSPQKAGFSGTPLFCCIVRRTRSAVMLTPRNAALGSNLHRCCKRKRSDAKASDLFLAEDKRFELSRRVSDLLP